LSDPFSGWAPPEPPLVGPQEPDSRQGTVADVPWNIGDAAFVLIIWFIVTVIIGGVLLAALQELTSETDAQALVLPITSIALILVVIAYVASRYSGAVRRLFGPARVSWTKLAVGVAAGIVALLVFAVGLGTLLELIARALRTELPQVQETFQEIAQDQSAAPLLILGSVLVAPFAEEIFYRGLLFTALRKRFDLWPAMGLSGMVFGLTHVQGSLEGYLLVVLIIMPLGMFLAYLYDRTKTLFVPIVAHAIFNLVQVLLLIQQRG
jgi:membrane protease YdiL (CAAX protease family)